MLRNLKIIFALALVACASAAYSADPPGRVGRLNYATGAVSFAPADAPDQWMQAPLNRPLTAGDRLWADNNSRAEIHVGSTALRLGSQTSVDVLNLDDHAIQLRLAQGAINVRVRELAPGDTIEIATPTGAVLVRQPGSYHVSADPQSESGRVAVNFGQAEVVTPTQTFTVPSSQAASFAAGANPSFEVTAFSATDDLDRWSGDRDRQQDRVASTRYVSPQMTGYEDLDQYGAWRTLPDYGAVWVPTRVATGWAPYRYGHWVWVSPWGWTWVDDAPWGFAPFHYGRWVWAGNYWAWAPGRIAPRPVYAPALVAFVGGTHASFSLTIGAGPAVGWFPLGWHDPYIPPYRVSNTYVRNVNVTHVTNVTNVTNIYNNSTNVTNVNYVNRNNPQAVTVVPQQAFVSARPVAQSRVQASPADLAKAEVAHARQPVEPVRASFAPERPGQRPPSAAAAREVVAVTAPPKPAAQATLAPQAGAAASQPRGPEHDPRVRVIGRERVEARAAEKGAVPARQPQAAAPAKEGAPAAAAGVAAKEAPAGAARPPQTAAKAEEKGPAAEVKGTTALPRPPQAAAPKAEEKGLAAAVKEVPRPPQAAAPRATEKGPAPAAKEAPAASHPPQAPPRSEERRATVAPGGVPRPPQAARGDERAHAQPGQVERATHGAPERRGPPASQPDAAPRAAQPVARPPQASAPPPAPRPSVAPEGGQKGRPPEARAPANERERR